MIWIKTRSSVKTMKRKEIIDFVIGLLSTILAMVLFYLVNNTIKPPLEWKPCIFSIWLLSVILFGFSFHFCKKPSQPFFFALFSNVNAIVFSAISFAYLADKFNNFKFFLYLLLDIESIWFLISWFYFIIHFEKDKQTRKKIVKISVLGVISLPIVFSIQIIDWSIFTALTAIMVTLISEDGVSAVFPLKSNETYERKLSGKSKVRLFQYKIFYLSVILVCALTGWEEKNLPESTKTIKLYNLMEELALYLFITCISALLVSFLYWCAKKFLLKYFEPEFKEPKKE